MSIRHFLSRCVLLLCLLCESISTAGEVYLVLGSDTAIWDGMDVGSYHCYYNHALYTDPAQNAYQVMNPAFRARFKDSYGQPLKMTWWMMAGNIYRYADNKNFPVPNIMTLYLMNKYHGQNAQLIGDEITLHYHTFIWTDYDGDGKYWWNQAKSFTESRDDFDFTLTQMLLEEQVFPVSFRSGWHYMDNAWQNYLNELLPYSLHNDWPHVRTDLTEPLDNTYDWSQSPATFVPFQPATENYQLDGNGPGWNVRSAHFNTVRGRDLMDSIFAAASTGGDQVACWWGHLPETDFISNIEILNDLAQQKVVKYPGVTFRYCTAVEAMQRWRQSEDRQSPQVTFTEESSGDEVTFHIASDEAIFQIQPFVAVKDIYERYLVLPCQMIAADEWKTSDPFPKNLLAKAGVAVCDTMGNQTLRFINFLPDDRYVDNSDSGYAELHGDWTTSSTAAWGVDSRKASLKNADSVEVRWYPSLFENARYNVFIQQPATENAAGQIRFTLYSVGQPIDTIYFQQPFKAKEWIYLTTQFLDASPQTYLEMTVNGSGQAGKIAAADVVKFSALVRERDIQIVESMIDFGQMSEGDSALYSLQISNAGVSDLRIENISSIGSKVQIAAAFPIIVKALQPVNITLSFVAGQPGVVSDTLLILSDDVIDPLIKLPVQATVQKYFSIADNEDTPAYHEFGQWFYSNAQAHGPTSRYANLNSAPRGKATFSVTLKKKGIYDISEIVPKTVNAANNALYKIRVAGVTLDSLYLNQNENSGSWVKLGRYNLPAGQDIEVQVIDDGKSSGEKVLRADAVRFDLIEEIVDIELLAGSYLPDQFRLDQNYPNPFNAKTVISYQLSVVSKVDLSVYDMFGQTVATQVSAKQTAGNYKVKWNATGFASGVYFYRLTVGSMTKTCKMILLR